MKIALDTNFLISLVSEAAANHALTLTCYQQLQQDGAECIIAEHALLEAFSVLSRAPKPLAMPPRDAERVLAETFRQATLAPFHRGLAWNAIRHTLERNKWGGRVYDTAIALAVFDAGARLLLTWDVEDMRSIAPEGLEVRAPDTYS